MDWMAALKSGLISGILLLLVPQGIPWAALTFYSGSVMGRTSEAESHLNFGRVIIHLLLALLYAIPVALFVRRMRSWRAVLFGGAIGIVLYFLNLAVTGTLRPSFSGNEFRVFVTHLIFGLFSSACYLGMVSRR